MSSIVSQILQTKIWLHKNRKLVFGIVLLGVFLCGVLLGTGIVTPTIYETHIQEQEDIPQTTHEVDLIYSETATVTQTTDLYTAGEVIEDNSLYHRSATDFRIQIIPVTTNAQVTDISTEVKYVGLQRTDTSNTVWERPRDSETASITETEDGLAIELDMANMREKTQQYRNVYGDEVLVTPQIETTISYEYQTYDGSTETNEYTSIGQIDFSGAGYQTAYTSTQDVATSGGISMQPSGVTENTAIAGFFILLLTIAGVTEYIWRTETPKEIEDRLQSVRYNEWITSVESYQSTTSNIILTKSLEDLVQLAIDIRGRVIHVKQTDEYFVIDNQTVYGYSEHVDAGQPPLSANFGIKYGDNDVDELSEDQMEDANFGMQISSEQDIEDTDFDFGSQNEDEEEKTNDNESGETDNSNSDDPFGGWRE